MEIKESDFKLTPISEHSILYDLELLYKVQPKGKEIRYEFKNVAYGISLETAIKKIAQYRVSCNHENDVLSLKTYIQEFLDNIKSIKNLITV